jgi:hypothetical protein
MTLRPRDQGCGRFGPPVLNRREMLARAGMGFGTLALADLLLQEGRLRAATTPDLPLKRSADAWARSVIFLFMGGGPSQVDTWDPKPEMAKLQGKPVPESIAAHVPRIARSRLASVFASPYRFTPRGESGLPVSAIFPEIGRHIDDLCVLRSCRHDTPIHAPAEYLSLTGTQVGDRPSLGAWTTYGLGSESRDLPAFVVFLAGQSTRAPGWASGFLPARYQGVVVQKEGIPHLDLPDDVTSADRQAQLDLIGRLNRRHLERHPGHSELEARLRSYELAYRMQTAAPEAFDLARETRATKKLYGLEEKDTAEMAAYCLLARRLVERGVRFIQIRMGKWDAHGDLVANHTPRARESDRPIAALLGDLKARGLLDETLVIWGGEFGRTPTAENPTSKSPGRDHSPSGYSMWLAGGGVRGGQAIGATDPVGYTAIEKPIHPNDLHATVLHALGIDQHDLYYEHFGRRELVTVNGGTVVREVFGA